MPTQILNLLENTINDTTDLTAVRLLKTSVCPSLSGKWKVTFEVGCDVASEVQLRISKNSGTGYFSKDWISWDQLCRLLEKNGRKPITCHTLMPLHEGRSVNTGGFLLAGLKHHGLVQPMEGKPRCYECTDSSAFVAEVQSLMGAAGAAKKAGRPKAASPAPKAGKAGRSRASAK